VPHFNLIQPIVSRHLKILRDVGVIRCRKDGAKRMYSIVDVRILSAVDAIAPDLINVLQKEAVRQMNCGSEME
jgi:DNA-binding transcriptional ArsR family regulator